MSNLPNILILGATGKVGGEVVHQLVKAKDSNVIAATRSPEKAQHLREQGIEVRYLDLNRFDTLQPALKGINRALLLTGYTVDMLKQSKAFLDTAKQTGVQHIVHLGASGAPTNEVAHWGWHQYIEKYIESLGFSFTHLRSEDFMQNVTEPGYRWLEGNKILNYAGFASRSWVDCDDVALLAAITLREARKYQGQIVPIGYDNKTFDEIAQIFTEVISKPFYVDTRPPEEFLTNILKTGADSAYMNCVYKQFKLDCEGKIPNAGATYDNFQAITGRKPINWREFTLKHYEEIVY